MGKRVEGGQVDGWREDASAWRERQDQAKRVQDRADRARRALLARASTPPEALDWGKARASMRLARFAAWTVEAPWAAAKSSRRALVERAALGEAIGSASAKSMARRRL